MRLFCFIFNCSSQSERAGWKTQKSKGEGGSPLQEFFAVVGNTHVSLSVTEQETESFHSHSFVVVFDMHLIAHLRCAAAASA